jgi:hypothetical protein
MRSRPTSNSVTPDADRVAGSLLAAIAARDYDAIAACFTADAHFLALTPKPQLREHTGRDEVADRYRQWLGSLEPFSVTASDWELIADRVRIRYRFRGRDPERGWQENEHTAYVRLDRDGRIALLTLSCAGFRPTAEPV